jgi:hypothetical protein
VEVANLWNIISWWAKFSKKILKEKARLTPWMFKKAFETFAQIGSHSI